MKKMLTLCNKKIDAKIIITAGSTYLDIDAYACAIAMAELLVLKGKNATAYSQAPYNYSICPSFVREEQMQRQLPLCSKKDMQYIIVDVSDPEYIKNDVPLDQVIAVYDHHVGFEAYWQNRIGDRAQIEFIGAAATLIYEEWRKMHLTHKMCPNTAKLLLAAILDNTLNLTSSNTTMRDRLAFAELLRLAKVGEEWCAEYFLEVQSGVEADLKNALFGDIKTITPNWVLPAHIAQIAVWEPKSIFARLSQIRSWLEEMGEVMLNIIDIQEGCSYFLCDDPNRQTKIERVFGVTFLDGIAKTKTAYLRKQILKKCINFNHA